MTGPATRLAKRLCGLLILLSAVWLAPTGTQAQIPGYDILNQLGGGGQAEEPQQSRPVAPPLDQTVPADGGQAGSPTAADYGRVASTSPDPMLDATSQAVEIFRARLKATIERLPEAFNDIDNALAASSPTGRASYFVGIALFAALLLVIGRAFTFIFYIYVARPLIVGIQTRLTNPQGYLEKLPLLAWRVFMTTVGAGIAVTVAVLIGLVFAQGHQPSVTTTIIVFATYALMISVDTVWRMALAPYLPRFRIPHFSDSDAGSLYRWLSIVSGSGILTMAFCYWVQALRLAPEVHTAITILLSLAIVLAFIVMAQVHRRAITGAILQGQPRDQASWPQVIGATIWFPGLILYMLFTWGDMSFRMVMGIDQAPFRMAMPYFIFLVGMIVYAAASYLIERVFARSREISQMNAELEAHRQAEDAKFQAEIRDAAGNVADEAADGPDVGDSDGDGDGEDGGNRKVETTPQAVRRPGMQTMEDLARRAASLFAIGSVVYALIRYWGGPEIFETNQILDLAQDVVDTLFLGYLVFHGVRIWIDQKIAEEVGDEDPTEIAEGEGGGAGATRLATILPLLRNFLLISIVISIILLIAVEFGVNVAPLFAGAGIVGLAIGFGSQTLVRDILSGAFFLMDDAFRKSEYIDVGEVKGTVEKISLRSFQLRHHLGKLHTIPFGEIQFLTNFSRDWVMMKLPLRLTYDTDPERVRKLIKKLGLRLLEDPEIGDKFIQPVKSQGVIQMDDSAMILRIKFMTHPGEQWVIRKRVLAEIRALFAAEGIKFAHREVTVRLPDLPEDRQLTAEEKAAIGAAARRVGDSEREQMEPAAAGGEVR
ncbi:MAG: mechanosensitive ion channel family protein [Pseudomonadota bacterium]